MLTKDDMELVGLVKVELSSRASLDRSPKKNWVEKSGSLPPYIREIAREVEKSGKSLSQAIAIAVSRVKKWAAGGDDIKADTKAKAAKALAQWDALKAKNAAKKLSLAHTEEGVYLMFSNTTSFNTELVRSAWDNIQRDKRTEMRAAARAAGLDPYENSEPYSWVKELWTDHLVVQIEGGTGIGGVPSHFLRVPYVVTDGDVVEFGEPVEVKQAWEEVSTLDADELAMLADVVLSKPASASERIVHLANSLRP